MKRRRRRSTTSLTRWTPPSLPPTTLVCAPRRPPTRLSISNIRLQPRNGFEKAALWGGVIVGAMVIAGEIYAAYSDRS